MARLKLYPIGIQTFEEIRRQDYLYIDKTEYIYRMTHTDGKYFFLSRPRRFGKSLLTSTFQSYFEGKKELFKGLAIDKLEKEWNTYPVLHFSMAGGKHIQGAHRHHARNAIHCLCDGAEIQQDGTRGSQPNQRQALRRRIQAISQKDRKGGHELLCKRGSEYT